MKTKNINIDVTEGHLDDDRGYLMSSVGIDVENNLVGLEFSQTIKWFAMPPEQAEEMANALLDKVKKLRELRGDGSHS